MAEITGRPGTWGAYVDELTAHATNAEIARRTSVSESTVGRWFGNPPAARISPASVIQLARVFDGNAVQALVAAEYITADEAELAKAPIVLPPSLDNFTDLELAQEIVARIESGAMPDSQIGTAEIIPFNRPNVSGSGNDVTQDEDVPYLGHFNPNELTERAADTRPRKGDIDHAE